MKAETRQEINLSVFIQMTQLNMKKEPTAEKLEEWVDLSRLQDTKLTYKSIIWFFYIRNKGEKFDSI